MLNQKSFLPVVIVPSAILLIPAAAMLFKVEGWAWDVSDFIIFWVLIASVLLAYKLVSRDAGRMYRAATGIALATGFLLLWINGAVGLIGSEDNPANLLYGGVLLIGAVGALMARFKSLGMARTLFATAFAQFLVPVIAFVVWRPDFSPGVVQVFVLNFVFVLLFAASAFLFRLAANTSGEARGQSAA